VLVHLTSVESTGPENMKYKVMARELVGGRTIADTIDKNARAELRKTKKPSGTKVARPRKQAS
jgi:hypothetical protein